MDSIHDNDSGTREIGPGDFPGLLSSMPNPPAFLRIRGPLPPSTATHTYITVIGSRKYTDYGKEACETLVKSLAGLPVVIVSGLALGMDSIAHRAALKYGMGTIAIPGSGLDEEFLYPASHVNLAREIVAAGGALISPFPDDTPAAIWTFPKRNAIMAGISKATLVIEAEIKSGTLITSKLATDYNRDVFAVPGSIFSKQSEGPHMLIRLGATPIRNGDDLRDALGFPPERASTPIHERTDLSPEELRLATIIAVEPVSREELFSRFGGDISDFNALISLLEIKEVAVEKEGRIMPL
ncbi:MAG: DNA-processing protein DprA [Candidatus Paceibacterota bacterium]|jgi:DNA processing protein